jgi:hypothetical protein
MKPKYDSSTMKSKYNIISDTEYGLRLMAVILYVINLKFHTHFNCFRTLTKEATCRRLECKDVFCVMKINEIQSVPVPRPIERLYNANQS